MQKRVFLVLFLFFNTLLSGATVEYGEFIQKQMILVEKMNENNVTQEIVTSLLEEQNKLYSAVVDKLMANKNKYLNHIKLYENEIFSLQKVIKINKRAGNNYAVIRDEVTLKSYHLLRLQNRMIKSVLFALDEATLEEFESVLNTLVAHNQEEVLKLFEKDYTKYLEIESTSRVLKEAQENIRDFYTLKDVNSDLIGYLYKFESKMYRLNKYSRYHLISVVIYVNSLSVVQIINPTLEKYGLNIMKLTSIFFLILVIYFFRKIVYVYLEKYLLKVDFLKDYSAVITHQIRGSLETIIIIININMIIYVYNDFSSIDVVSRLFNIVYGFYFTLIVYKVINVIAAVKLNKVSGDKSTIKNDLVNVGLKIINFIILIMGLLIILFFAGVNLTAVLSGLGIGGFAVAFAAKDTISNFFGTLSILFSDVFSQGDWIEIDGHQGVVVEIGLRVTTIRTFDNALIAIPNGTFASKDVKNWDKRILGRRIKMHIGVKYDSKSEDIKNAISEIRYMLDKHPGIATKATKYSHQERKHMARLVSKDDLEGVKNNLLVYLDNFGDSSINILIYCFTKSVKWAEWLETKEDVMHNIMAILEKNNLAFAFPSLSVYNEKMGEE